MPSRHVEGGNVGRRGFRLIAGWLALAACLFQLMAPLAWAAARDGDDPLADALIICTPDGFRVLNAATSDRANNPAEKEWPADRRADRPLCPACTGAAHAILPVPQEIAPLTRFYVDAGPARPARISAASNRPLRLHPVRAPPLV